METNVLGLKKSLFYYKNLCKNLFSCFPIFFFSTFSFLQNFSLLKMPQKHINRKHQILQQDITPVFTSASALFSSKNVLETPSLPQIEVADSIPNDLSNKSDTVKISLIFQILFPFHKYHLKFKKTFIAKKL